MLTPYPECSHLTLNAHTTCCCLPIPAAMQADVPDSTPSNTDTFRLHSRPSAVKKIYLDFTGHTTEGTEWNAKYNRQTIVTPPFDTVSSGGGGGSRRDACAAMPWFCTSVCRACAHAVGNRGVGWGACGAANATPQHFVLLLVLCSAWGGGAFVGKVHSHRGGVDIVGLAADAVATSRIAVRRRPPLAPMV